ncbi:MAG: type I secretion system permease/ATPase [Parvularculaceae bacterium]|nr:type I secretion system permease/ATPase [Parvularculaceae bacterium]
MLKLDDTTRMQADVRAGIASARPLLVRAAVFSVAVNILMLTGPLYMLQLYDRVLASRSGATLLALTVLAVALYGASSVIDFVRSALIARAASRFETRIADRAFDAAVDLARLSPSSAGDAPFRDVRAIRQALNSGAVISIFDAPFAPFYLMIVFMLHWSLGVLALAGALALVALAVINERISRKTIAAQMESQQASDALAGAAMRNAATADALGMRGAMRARWRALNDSVGDARGGDRMLSITSATKTGRLALQSLILGLGAWLAIRGVVTGGVMVAASIIAARALAPVEMAIGQWRLIGAGMQAFTRLNRILAAAPANEDRTALPPPSGRLTLERVFVRPVGVQKPVLKNISVSVSPGEALGVIGPSGAGKSTLARVMAGVEPIASGAVRLDGADIFQQPRDVIGRAIGYLPQETELFTGTIRENIARFREDAIDEDIVAAAREAGALDLILAQADGFETRIAERGPTLSVGQRQRVGLARALYGRPALVILDEPNAALDAEGEAALVAAIVKLKARGAAVVIVAHRPSALVQVDRLLFLVDGEQRALGPRDEVLARITGPRVSPTMIGQPLATQQPNARVTQDLGHDGGTSLSNG